MPVETFTLEQFRNALPKDPKKNDAPIFNHIGMIDGEHCFAMELREGRLRILVRSSIDGSGISAECGGDSIRIMIERKFKQGWRVIGKGPDSYTTREPGWSHRLKEKLYITFAKASYIKQPFVDNEIVLFCKKAGNNYGRPMAMLSVPKEEGGSELKFLRWLDA